MVIVCVALGLVFQGCTQKRTEAIFERLTSDQTNIIFNNRLTETDTFNVLTFEYIYNGAGVGVGDVNNDGLTDVYFAGNMVSSRLYLNKGDFIFEDVTEKAMVQTSLWCTGVAMTDVNQDGLLDIYVSTIQPHMDKAPVPNLLFLNKGTNNDGVPTFKEVAARVGLADSSYATQAAFLDYDLDGDLDMYLLTNALETFNRNQVIGQKNDGTGRSVDKFYRNEGMTNGLPRFRDVSREAGVLAEGWGLGIVVNDVNKDGYPDIYVSNDFVSNDQLLINTGRNSFTNEIASMMKHQEQNGMGMDIADINNDALNDIVVVDMLPDDNLRQKTMFSNIGYDRFMLFRSKGYEDQYIRNVLQLNNGNNTFSDIGYLAGIYATDWSWSSLLADFDNDGYRDLFIGNGYRKDITDQDFIAYSKQVSMFATDRNRMNTIRQEVEKLPGVRKPNFLFRNNGDLTFSDNTFDWGLDEPSYSNGAAYADFDNDGDLDLVTNNINDEAFLYRNNLIDGDTNQESAFLRIKLKGEKGNMQGLGARISIYTNDKVLFAEHQTQRGYKSTVEDVEHFGLGVIPTGSVDSIEIVWSRGRSQKLRDVRVNQLITIEEKQAKILEKENTMDNPLFKEHGASLGIRFTHDEPEFVDFLQTQFLLPRKYSQDGPGISVGDVNGDDLDDFIIGGSASKKATVFIQKIDGTFRTDSLPAKEAEDMGLLLFDADNDDDLDLYCVSGSSEFKDQMEQYHDRLYRNAGNGEFIPDPDALPQIKSSGSTVVGADFDRDGDIDLFVGGRLVPMRYPEVPVSYLLVNNGNGVFEDMTSELSASLKNVGMVTSALWTDINNDGWMDLAVVGEWMPVTFFVSNQGHSFTAVDIPNSSGWWNSISGGDFDNDGDIDYIAGNLGLNSIYKASVEEPVSVVANDFDSNGSFDAIMCRYIQGKEYPVHPRDALIGQISYVKGIAHRYSEYGTMGITDLIPEEKLRGALTLKSTSLQSVYIENTGNNKFRMKPLPVEAQFAPMFGIDITDVNGDGYLDVLAVGNSYACEPLSGHYDAGIGNCLEGDGRGNFTAVPVTKSGFFVDGDAKGLASLRLASGRSVYLVSQNRGELKVFMKNNEEAEPRKVVRLKFTDTHAVIYNENGTTRKQEFYFGSGYLSSSSRTLISDGGTARIAIFPERDGL